MPLYLIRRCWCHFLSSLSLRHFAFFHFDDAWFSRDAFIISIIDTLLIFRRFRCFFALIYADIMMRRYYMIRYDMRCWCFFDYAVAIDVLRRCFDAATLILPLFSLTMLPLFSLHFDAAADFFMLMLPPFIDARCRWFSSAIICRHWYDVTRFRCFRLRFSMPRAVISMPPFSPCCRFSPMPRLLAWCRFRCRHAKIFKIIGGWCWCGACCTLFTPPFITWCYAADMRAKSWFSPFDAMMLPLSRHAWGFRHVDFHFSRFDAAAWYLFRLFWYAVCTLFSLRFDDADVYVIFLLLLPFWAAWCRLSPRRLMLRASMLMPPLSPHYYFADATPRWCCRFDCRRYAISMMPLSLFSRFAAAADAFRCRLLRWFLFAAAYFDAAMMPLFSSAYFAITFDAAMLLMRRFSYFRWLCRWCHTFSILISRHDDCWCRLLFSFLFMPFHAAADTWFRWCHFHAAFIIADFFADADFSSMLLSLHLFQRWLFADYMSSVFAAFWFLLMPFAVAWCCRSIIFAALRFDTPLPPLIITRCHFDALIAATAPFSAASRFAMPFRVSLAAFRVDGWALLLLVCCFSMLLMLLRYATAIAATIFADAAAAISADFLLILLLMSLRCLMPLLPLSPLLRLRHERHYWYYWASLFIDWFRCRWY